MSRFGRSQLPLSVQNDIRWFTHILEHEWLQALPLNMFSVLPLADIHLYMDASNSGLAVLNTSCNEFIQVQFDDDERRAMCGTGDLRSAFSINVREHFCMALAAWVWGPRWADQAASGMTHIKCWSDNAVAVSWNNSLYSANTLAQEINRAIGLAEAICGIRMSASHLSRSTNVMVDAASRAWMEPYKTTWTNFSVMWSQVQVPEHLRKIYKPFSKSCSPNLWPTPRCQNTSSPGSNGLHHSHQLTLFAVYAFKYGWGRTKTGNSAATVLTKIDHISWTYQRYLGYGVGILPGHRLAIEGMRKIGGAPVRRAPITMRILSKLHADLNFNTTQDRVVWGAAVMGFFFLLRRSEYLSIGSKHHRYAIRRSNISFEYTSDKEYRSSRVATKVSIKFCGSKNDQGGEGVSRALSRFGSRWCCLVKALQFLVSRHVSIGAHGDDFLCKVPKTSNLQARALAMALKTAAKETGENEALYGLHSLRSGGATAMFELGIDSLAIKQFERWKSDAFERYTRMNAQVTETLTSAMIGQAQH